MRIRLEGTEQEVKAAMAALVAAKVACGVSRTYRNRGASEIVRCYAQECEKGAMERALIRSKTEA